MVLTRIFPLLLARSQPQFLLVLFPPVRSHYNLFVEFGGAFGISVPSSSAAAAPAAGSGSARNFSNDFASSDQSNGGYQSGPAATYQPMPAPAGSSGYQGISDAKATF